MKLMILLPLMALLLAGCGNGGNTVRYAELKDRDVMVRVGDTDVIKARFEKDVQFRMLLETKRHPRITVAQAKKFEETLREGGVDYLVQKKAYAAEAAARKIRPSADDLEKARKGFLRKYAHGRQKWDKFMKDLGPAAEQAAEELAFEALRLKVDRELKVQLRQEIPAAELDKIIAERTAYNKRSELKNAEIYAFATNVWQGIVSDKATNAFEKAAAKLENREHVSYDEAWNNLTDEMFKEEPVIKGLLPTMKIGDITPPIEGDNGLVILKLTRKGFSGGFGTQPRQATYDFKKIFFALPAFAEELPREAFAKQIADKRAAEAAKNTIADRCKSIVVNYPKGKVVFK